MRRPFLDRQVSVLGQPLPMAVIGLIVFSIVGSTLLAFGQRMGIGLAGLTPLLPSAVMHGQVWRLLTWGFFEGDGQSLVFASLLIGFSGRDLTAAWGGRRFIALCAGIVFGTGIAATIVGIAWRDVYLFGYLTLWPLADALVIAWSVLFPNRTILFMFVLPAAGRNLLYATVGITVIFSLMHGFSYFVPHFLAMGLMYAYIRGGAIWRTRARLGQLLTPKRDTRGLKVVEGGRNRDPKGPNGSGWVH